MTLPAADVERQCATVEALLKRHDLKCDAIVIDSVAAVNAEIGIKGVVEAGARSPVIEIAVARALIERLHDWVAVAIPA